MAMNTLMNRPAQSLLRLMLDGCDLQAGTALTQQRTLALATLSRLDKPLLNDFINDDSQKR
jgi:hypothetical protein